MNKFITSKIVAAQIARTERNDEGAVAVEYAALIVGVGLLVLAAAAVLGGDISDFFGDVGDKLVVATTP